MKKHISIIFISMLLFISACSSAGGLGAEVEESKLQREDDQSKSVEERQLDTLNQLIQDGAYIEDVTYQTPAGSETLEVMFQIKDDIIEKIEFNLKGEAHKISLEKTTASEEALKSLLIGKNLNDVELPTAIAGSSLTTTAFKKHVQDLTIRY